MNTSSRTDRMAPSWTLQDAEELYDIAHWGQGYIAIEPNGDVAIQPNQRPDQKINLKELIERLKAMDVFLPVLVRFNDIIRHRMDQIHTAFRTAIREYDYRGDYTCLYPIKVNQQRHVVEKVFEYGRRLGFGLEAGSKPELLIVMAIADNDTPIVCNGFKDDEFIQIALSAQKIGRNVTIIVEKYSELELILKHSEELGVRPAIGVRIKLATRGSGRWKSSGGLRSKFGLTTSEVMSLLEELQSREMADCLTLLHFHMGSQITNIRHIKAGITEGARVYAQLVQLGAKLGSIDIGGGLGIDYDGSQTDFGSSMNYTLQEYANDVIYHIGAICDEAEVPHPVVLSESGRAITAYHSVLVFNVVGVATPGLIGQGFTVGEDDPQPLQDLQGTLNGINSRNLIESLHDAQQAFDQALSLFSLGYMSLEQRAAAESLYWMASRKISRHVEQLDDVPEELEGLADALSDNYFCNFSLFQSLPDSWAIKQLFPVIPLHRMNERPTHRVVLEDITCDSDGRIDQFIDRRDVKRALPLHEFSGDDYFLGVFLVGAYQEILGDLHNLFGDTNAVHVSLDENGEVHIDTVVEGDTVAEVIGYVEFRVEMLREQLRQSVEQAIGEGRVSTSDARSLMRFYDDATQGYTYLEEFPVPHHEED